MTTSDTHDQPSMMDSVMEERPENTPPKSPRPPKSPNKKKDKTNSSKSVTDNFIMNTNNSRSEVFPAVSNHNLYTEADSSIVSKRSVEKMYYPGRKEYFRHFVRKFQRRSPLINRGYWLRMKAVDSAVKKFLKQDLVEGKRKIVVNLGCGYDPNPFEYLDREPDLCDNVTFVDVDYPQLIRNKYDMIKSSSALLETVPDLQPQPADSAIIAKAEKYLAIGCDLRDLERLDQVLRSEFDISDTAILFTAEVSIAYMTLEAANAVFAWAATFPDTRFCLLEQQIPDGRDHPFARTMLKHFEKLRSPLHAVGTMEQMRGRFEDAGWPAAGVEVRSLWELWADPTFLSAEERLGLDGVEAFDEWEELALFGSHYLVLVAEKTASVLEKRGTSKEKKAELVGQQSTDAASQPDEKPAAPDVEQTYCCLPIQGKPSHRRFAAALPSDDKEKILDKVAAHGGLGTKERLLNCDTYTISDSTSELSPPPLAAGLMCHTITAIDKSNCLLVGGRTSPDKASASCWYRKDGEWSKVHDLPEGRYRHCAVAIEGFARDAYGVVVFGGKNSRGEVLDDWLLWQPSQGWTRLESTQSLEARFGASMTLLYDQADRGYLTGGLRRDGTVVNDFWVLEFRKTDDKLVVVLEDCTKQMTQALGGEQQFLGRFGAAFVATPTSTLLVGGVAGNTLLDRKHELLDVDNRRFVGIEADHRPLLIGFTPLGLEKATNDILVLGGGATCFSFGTYWNDGCVLRLGDKGDEDIEWRLLASPSTAKYGHAKTTNGKFKTPSELNQEDRPILPDNNKTSNKPKTIPRRTLSSAADFELIRHEARPVILTGLDLGPCTSLWTPEYLTNAIGADRPVVVHSSPSPHMSFAQKNFTYETQPFGPFISSAVSGAHTYLRAVSSTSPSQHPTTLAADFPSIAPDFVLPESLQYVRENAHSSPFRVSGNVTMWLHYDVLPNILAQIHGPKRLLLYAPSSVTSLSFPPGASSSTLNPFIDDVPVTAHEALLAPGEVLYIPPMWLHAAEPTEGLSVAVNVFFKEGEMEGKYSAGRDVYGNRDLAAYERGRRDVERIGRSFEGLGVEVRRFYILRLAEELAGMC